MTIGRISVAPALAAAGGAFALISLLCGGALGHEDFVKDIVQLTSPESRAPPFDDATVGHDLHNDYFYFDDNAVAEAYKRNKYTSAKMTLAGQAPDMTGRKVKAAKRPFAVGQKSGFPFGTSDGRWDVKEDRNGYQFFAVYHGFKSGFVVNKLRAHLLARVANAVKDYLPILDRLDRQAMEEDVLSVPLHTISEDIKQVIVHTFGDVDELIKQAMKDNDDSGASAAVAIVTERFVIAANAGEGRIVSYDTNNEIFDLSAPQYGPAHLGFVEPKRNGFGLRKSKPGTCVPEVNMTPRFYEDEDGDEAQLAFLLLESPTVAKVLPREIAVKIVVSKVGQHRDEPGHEQDLYTSSVTGLLNLAHSQSSWFSSPDFTVALVSLTNYTLIH